MPNKKSEKKREIDRVNFIYAMTESVQEGIWAIFLSHMERFGYSEADIEKMFEEFREEEGVS